MSIVGIATGAVILFTLLMAWRSRSAHTGGSRRRGAAAVLAAGFALVLVGPSVVQAAIVPTVPLGTAENFSVLGGQSVTNTGPSIIDLSVGVSPGTSITGFPPGIVGPPGTIQNNTPVAQQAQADLTAAYNNAAGRTVTTTLDSGELGGRMLVGGVYAGPDKSPLTLTGTLTLDGENNPDSVFIFQTNSTLTTASASTIVLINGATACNVFFQVGSSATLGSGSTFRGNILALTSISLNDAVTVEGRALARNGGVTLINDRFIAPDCDAPVTSTTVPGGSTTVPGASTTVPGASTTVPGASTTVPGASTTTPGATTTGPGVPSTTIARTGSAVGSSLVWAALILALGVAITFISRRGSVPRA